jgi:hypothetical protein
MLRPRAILETQRRRSQFTGSVGKWWRRIEHGEFPNETRHSAVVHPRAQHRAGDRRACDPARSDPRDQGGLRRTPRAKVIQKPALMRRRRSTSPALRQISGAASTPCAPRKAWKRGAEKGPRGRPRHCEEYCCNNAANQIGKAACHKPRGRRRWHEECRQHQRNGHAPQGNNAGGHPSWRQIPCPHQRNRRCG